MYPDFKELLSLFNGHKVKYLVVGGYAVSFFLLVPKLHLGTKMVAKQELGGNCVPKQELGNEQKRRDAFHFPALPGASCPGMQAPDPQCTYWPLIPDPYFLPPAA